MARGSISRTFIGRAAELVELQRCYRLAAAGRAVTVVLSGDAGVGKTRLLAELRRAIKDDRPQFAIGYAHESAQAPYAPFIEALRGLPVTTSARWLREHPLLDRTTPPRLSPAGVLEEKLRRFVATADMLRERAVPQPIVLVIEDAHWADLATLELVHYLTRSLGAARMLLVVTHRSEEPARLAQYTRLTALARDAESHLELQPLAPSEVRRLFATIIGQRRVLPVATMQRIEELTEGRPFVAEELLRSVLDSRARRMPAVPVSLKASILERAERLGRDERDVLAHAAVIGRTFDAALLAQLLARPIDYVLGVLRDARDLQLIIEEPHGESVFSFRHALACEVLYGGLLAAQARAVHGTIMRHLESLGDLERAPVATLAYHAWAARDGAKAVAYNTAAGSEAAAMFAHADAARFFDRALEFAEPAAPTAELLEKLATVRYMSGEIEGTLDAYERALRLAGDAAPPAKIVELLIHIARLEHVLGRVDRARTTCELALQAVRREADEAGRMLVHVQLAAIEVFSGNAEEALTILAAVEPDTMRDRPDTIGKFYERRAYARSNMGLLSDAMHDYDRALAIAEEHADPAQLLQTKNNVASRAALIGDYERAERLYAECLELAQTLHHAKIGPLIAHAYAGVCFTLGRYKDARRLFETGLSLGAGGDTERLLAAHVGMRLGMIELDDDLIALCGNEELIEIAFQGDEAQNIASTGGTFVALFEQQGRHADAAALRKRTIAVLPNADVAYWLLDAVARAGDADEVARGQVLLERAARPPEDRTAGAYLALFRARTARREGRADEWAACARDAIERFTVLTWPLETGWALEEAGRSLEALAIYRAAGVVRDERRLEAQFPAERTAAGPLTRRERQIAGLVAAGRSNREIATQLVISERTVEAHLASVFQRLGVHTRLELATRLLRTNPA